MNRFITVLKLQFISISKVRIESLKHPLKDSLSYEKPALKHIGKLYSRLQLTIKDHFNRNWERKIYANL